MNRKEVYDLVAHPTLLNIETLLNVKGDEYVVGSDVFHIFKEASRLGKTNKSPIRALEDMCLKHEVSVNDMIVQYDNDIREFKDTGVGNIVDRPDLKKIIEKFDDILVYTILKKAMLIDYYYG